MTRLVSSSLAALAAMIVSVAGLHFVQQSRAREAARLRAENGRMRLEASQRHHAQMSARAPAATQSSAPLTSTAAPEPARESPAGDYRNEGQASPLATLQTFAWACDRGDSDMIRSLLCFEAAGRVKAEAFIASLPPAARARWSSPEAMAAELLTHQGMQQPFPAAKILERAVPEPREDGQVTLRLPGTPKDGTVYQKIGDHWHYVITEAAVDRYIASRKTGDH